MMDMKRSWILAGAALVAAFAGLSPASAQPSEFRAMWVSRFEYPHPDPQIGPAIIDGLMAELADANFNAVFFQVRGQGDVLYPSPEEVWSPLIGGADPGYDPLAVAIASAHAHGLEFHAYINTHTCWQSDPAEAHTLPDDPNHLFWDHCNADDAEHRDWLHHSNPLYPVQFSESNYVWLAPGVPECQAYTRRQIMYVVENYDVDGVHFDRIRTPWSNQPSYDPISLARHADGRTNPDGLDFGPWTRDQITRQVRDIYGAIMSIKPHVKVSAAVFPNSTTAPESQHQDAPTWARDGALDIIVPMMYGRGGEGSGWDSQLTDWLNASSGRHVVAGQITSVGSSWLTSQVLLSRVRGAAGNSVFSWSSFNYWSDYGLVYGAPAATPALPWKDDPTHAIIVGRVRAPGGAAVVDAQILRTYGPYVALSGADGFYTFLKVPPGIYTLTASHPDYESGTRNVQVEAGDIVEADLTFGVTAIAGDANGDGAVDLDELIWMDACLTGPGANYSPGHVCKFNDGDNDGDVDLADLAEVQRHIAMGE